jgi:hypothetical protein
MNATNQTQGKVMRKAIRVAKGITPARLLRGAAMGAMLIAATAFVYQELNRGEVNSFSSGNQATQAVPAQLDSEGHEAKGMPPDAVRNSTVDRTLSNIELERMNYEADLMLRKAAHQPSAVSSSSNRGIERLEARIDHLLAEAARDPSKNTSSLNQEIERLDERIAMLLMAAHKTPVSGQTSSGAARASAGWELRGQLADAEGRADAEERAYDELSQSFIGIPFSSEQSGSWPPDTEYYLDPDYREREMAK